MFGQLFDNHFKISLLDIEYSDQIQDHPKTSALMNQDRPRFTMTTTEQEEDHDFFYHASGLSFFPQKDFMTEDLQDLVQLDYQQPCQYQTEDISSALMQHEEEKEAINFQDNAPLLNANTLSKRSQVQKKSEDKQPQRRKREQKAETKKATILSNLSSEQIKDSALDSNQGVELIPIVYKTGRPFIGKDEVNQEGKEDKVKEKRAIFRAHKKIIGNLIKPTVDYKVNRNISLRRNLRQDPEIIESELKQYIEQCRSCICYDHYLEKGTKQGYSKEFLENNMLTFKNNKQTYIHEIGDPCYRYKRQAKERFFKKEIHRKVFLHTYFFIRTGNYYDKKSASAQDPHGPALEELKNYALSLEKNTSIFQALEAKFH